MNTVILWFDTSVERSVMVLATSNVLSEDISCFPALLGKAALGSTLCRSSCLVPCFKPPDLMNWTKKRCVTAKSQVDQKPMRWSQFALQYLRIYPFKFMNLFRVLGIPFQNFCLDVFRCL